MKKVAAIHSFDELKLLADSRRMDILRLLMASPATLTGLARILKQSPAWVRHHVLALEAAKKALQKAEQWDLANQQVNLSKQYLQTALDVYRLKPTPTNVYFLADMAEALVRALEELEKAGQ